MWGSSGAFDPTRFHQHPLESDYFCLHVFGNEPMVAKISIKCQRGAGGAAGPLGTFFPYGVVVFQGLSRGLETPGPCGIGSWDPAGSRTGKPGVQGGPGGRDIGPPDKTGSMFQYFYGMWANLI